MPHDPRKCLEDIRQAASLILTATSNRTREEYLNDLILRAAVEREFEIVGEALNRIRKIAPTVADKIPEHGRIIAFRNVLAHAYDTVDHGVVWLTIANKLPELLRQVELLLAAMPPP